MKQVMKIRLIDRFFVGIIRLIDMVQGGILKNLPLPGL